MAFLLHPKCIFPGLYQHFLLGCEIRHQMWQTPFLSGKHADNSNPFSGARKRGHGDLDQLSQIAEDPRAAEPNTSQGVSEEASMRYQADSNTSEYWLPRYSEVQAGRQVGAETYSHLDVLKRKKIPWKCWILFLRLSKCLPTQVLGCGSFFTVMVWISVSPSDAIRR